MGKYIFFYGDDMYKKFANKITDYFISKGIIDSSDKEIYAYSYEVMISQSVYIVIMLLIAILFGKTFESLIFFLGFYICRRLSGGFHASTYTKCHIIFALNHVVFLLLLNILAVKYIGIFTIATIVISIITILLLAPIDHPNKPFSQKELLKYKKYSRIFIILVSLICMVLVVFGLKSKILFCFCFGVFSVSMSLLYAYLERGSKNEQG